MLNLRYVMLAKINGIFVWRERMPRSFLTEDEFISSCQDAANGENESGTGRVKKRYYAGQMRSHAQKSNPVLSEFLILHNTSYALCGL